MSTSGECKYIDDDDDDDFVKFLQPTATCKSRGVDMTSFLSLSHFQPLQVRRRCVCITYQRHGLPKLLNQSCACCCRCGDNDVDASIGYSVDYVVISCYQRCWLTAGPPKGSAEGLLGGRREKKASRGMMAMSTLSPDSGTRICSMVMGSGPLVASFGIRLSISENVRRVGL